MDHRIIRGTPFSGGYRDSPDFLRYVNAVGRLSKPRDVENMEVDVETVCRNDFGSAYAVVTHYPDGQIESDMLIKTKGGGWSYYNTNFRIHPNFVSRYIASIYGYRQPTEKQIASELAFHTNEKRKAAFVGSSALFFYSGGIDILRCSECEDSQLPIPVESIDFVAYEDLARDDIKEFYGNLLQRFVANKDYDVKDIPKDLIMNILENSLARLNQNMARLKKKTSIIKNKK